MPKPSVKLSRKRKAETDLPSTGYDDTPEADANSALATMTQEMGAAKHTKNDTCHSAHKRKAAPTEPQTQASKSPRQRLSNHTPSPPAKPAPSLSPAVRRKLQQIHTFIKDTLPTNGTILTRDATKPTYISIAASSVQAALTRMQMHFEIERPETISLDDLGETLVSRYVEKRTEYDVECLVVDVSKTTELEKRIKEKIMSQSGGEVDVDGVNLFEVELEMVWRDTVAWFSEKKRGVPTEDEVRGEAERMQRTFDEVYKRTKSVD